MRWTVSLMVVPVMVLSSFTMTGRAADLPGIPPETVTDYIHAIIEADRTFYTIHVVERMQKQGGSPAAENWRAEKKTLPLPAQFLAEASDLSSKTGTKVRYRLISLWPINSHNGLDGEPEKRGLESVEEHPERSATRTVKIGDQTYFKFKAIYADRAVSQSALAVTTPICTAPRKVFKLDDIMSDLVIEVPLGR
jgi:hypothetical protein